MGAPDRGERGLGFCTTTKASSCIAGVTLKDLMKIFLCSTVLLN